MRAWRVRELGDPEEALKLEEIEDPSPEPGEVVVKVEAATLNFFNILLCRGEYQERPELPFTLGAEVSGTVSEVGEGADLEPAARVLAAPRLPEGGGRRTDGRDLQRFRRRGRHRYREENFVEVVKETTEGLGVDVIFDRVGGDVFDASRRCVAFEGRIVVIGFTGGRIAEAPTDHLLVKNYSVVGLHWGLYGKVMGHLVREAHEELMRLYEEGRIDPLVGEVVPFEEVPQALMLLGSRSTRGKIVTRRLAALEGPPAVGYLLASASRSGGISSKSSPSTRSVRNPAS